VIIALDGYIKKEAVATLEKCRRGFQSTEVDLAFVLLLYPCWTSLHKIPEDPRDERDCTECRSNAE
jgi:hypothetical protein